MTRANHVSLSIALALSLVLAVPATLVATTPAAANHTGGDGNSSYFVTQGDRCIEITPHGNGSESVESFYDYRNPETEPSSYTYSSHGTTHIQESQVSKLFVYHGSDGVSLVFLHSELYGNDTNGSTATMELSRLPEGSWAVQDDYYQNGTQDDNWETTSSTASIDWMWGPERNDGGAYRGLENMNSDDGIVVSPQFNEDADHWGDWSYSNDSTNRVTEWVVRSANGTETTLDMDKDVTVERGTCAADGPVANLTATPEDPVVDETVTLDASNSTGDDIARFHWDVDGDGDVDETTTESTVDTSYESSGTFEPTVTVTDRHGENATATTEVTVRDETAPEARVNASSTNVAVGESVEFDASASSDNVEIASYDWALGDDSSATGETVTHAYESEGTYDVTLTVTDYAGNEDTDSVTVTVEATDAPPTAELDVQDSAIAGENVTFDAGNSSDDGEITEYRWDVDDDDSVETTTAKPTLSRNFSSTGDHTVTVTVVDSANQTDTATATVSVTDNSDPTATATADPKTVTVGTAITFDGTDSSDSQGISSYTWDFDDGNTSEEATDTHTYSSAGTYEVILTVTDDAGNEDTDTVTVTVEAETEDAPPTAALDGQATAEPGETVTFDASASSDDSEITEYRWDVDGDPVETTTEPTLTRNFSSTGDHTVTVTVVDSANQTDTATTTISVEAKGGDDGNSDDGSNDDSSNTDSGDDDSNSDDSNDDTSNDNSNTDPSSGNNGGGGGVVPVGDGDDEPTADASIERGANGSLALTVEAATAGEPVSVEVPADGDDGTGLRAIELVPANDADQLNVTLVPERDVHAPDGTETGLFELTVADGAAVERVTYQFAVDSAELDLSQRLRVLAGNGSGLTTVDHTVVERGSTMLVNATANDIGRVALATVESDLSARSVTTDGPPIVGQQTTIETTIANDGRTTANRTVKLAVGGTIVDSKNVTVPADGAVNVSFETTFDSTGDRRVTVAGIDRTLSVVSPDGAVELVDVSLEQTQVTPGEPVTVSVTFENTGPETGTARANLSFVGDVVDVERVSVAPGEEETITFEQSIDAPGNYTVGVNGEQRTVTVSGEDTASNDTESTAEPSPSGGKDTELAVAGFGVLIIGVAALVRFL